MSNFDRAVKALNGIGKHGKVLQEAGYKPDWETGQ